MTIGSPSEARGARSRADHRLRKQAYLGWQESLEHLARLVEPEIPD